MAGSLLSNPDVQIIILNILRSKDISAANQTVEKYLADLNNHLEAARAKDTKTKDDYFLTLAIGQFQELIALLRATPNPEIQTKLVKALCNYSDAAAYNHYMTSGVLARKENPTIKDDNLLFLRDLIATVAGKFNDDKNENDELDGKVFEIFSFKIDDCLDDENKSRCSKYISFVSNEAEKAFLNELSETLDTALSGIPFKTFETNLLTTTSIVRESKSYKQIVSIYQTLALDEQFRDPKLSSIVKKDKLTEVELDSILDLIEPTNLNQFVSSSINSISFSIPVLRKLAARGIALPFCDATQDEFIKYIKTFPLKERDDVVELYKDKIHNILGYTGYTLLFEAVGSDNTRFLGILASTDDTGIVLKWLLSFVSVMHYNSTAFAKALRTAYVRTNQKNNVSLYLKAFRHAVINSGNSGSDKTINDRTIYANASKYYSDYMSIVIPYLNSLVKIEGKTISEKIAFFEETANDLLQIYNSFPRFKDTFERKYGKSYADTCVKSVRYAAVRIVTAMADVYMEALDFKTAEFILSHALTQDIIIKPRNEEETRETKSAGVVQRKLNEVKLKEQQTYTLTEKELNAGAQVVYDHASKRAQELYLKQSTSNFSFFKGWFGQPAESIVTAVNPKVITLVNTIFETNDLVSLKEATDYFISINNTEVSLLLATLLSALTENPSDRDHYADVVKTTGSSENNMHNKLANFLRNLLRDNSESGLKHCFDKFTNYTLIMTLLAVCTKAAEARVPIECFVGGNVSDIGDMISGAVASLIRLRGFTQQEARKITDALTVKSLALHKQHVEVAVQSTYKKAHVIKKEIKNTDDAEQEAMIVQLSELKVEESTLTTEDAQSKIQIVMK